MFRTVCGVDLSIRPLLIVAVIEENGVRLRLNIVDTPGYGDQVNNDRWYEYKALGGGLLANRIKLGPNR